MSSFAFDINDNETLSISEDICRLNRLWRTEVNSPEIMPFAYDLIPQIQEKLLRQERAIEGKDSNPFEKFTMTLYKMDIERIKYSLMRYLRTRLLKIDKTLYHLVNSENLLNGLSIEERKYATSLFKLTRDFFEESLGNRLSSNITESELNEDDINRHSQPNLEQYVLCRVLSDVGAVEVGNSEMQDFRRNEIHAARYNTIREHILNEKIELI